jgi:hypothetical protein
MKSVQNFIMRPYRATFTACLLFLIVTLQFGCSAARFGYSNGEMLSYWWLDGYVKFNKDQRSRVKKELANLFAWHRQTQLQEYVRLLKHAQGRVQHKVTEAELLAGHDEIKKHILVLVDKALPAMADLALSLQAEQIDNIDRKLTAHNDEYRKDYVGSDLEKRQRSRYKKALKQAENWFGSFSPEQKQQIRAVSDARPLNSELVFSDRVQRQAELIAMLKKIHAEQPKREVAMAMIRSYIVATLDRSFTPEHKAFFDSSRAGSIQLAAFIINIAAPEQKERFIDVTQRWIDDFTAMSM